MSYVNQVLEQAAAIGGRVDELLAPARAYRARAEDINRSLGEVRTACEREHAVLVERIVDGDLVDVQVIPQEIARLTAWAYDSAASKALVAGVAACNELADRAVVAAAPAIFEALQRLCADVVAESVRRAAKLPRDVVDAHTALQAGEAEAGSWRRLGALVGVWARAHGLAKVLRTANWIAGPAHPRDGLAWQMGPALRDPATFCTFRRPDLLPPSWASQPDELKLATAAAAGCEPGLYDWSDACARLYRYRRGAGDTLTGQPGQTVQTQSSFLLPAPIPPQPLPSEPRKAGSLT